MRIVTPLTLADRLLVCCNREASQGHSIRQHTGPLSIRSPAIAQTQFEKGSEGGGSTCCARCSLRDRKLVSSGTASSRMASASCNLQSVLTFKLMLRCGKGQNR